ncbi:sigma-70 family RNA polymerase sigma factor [Anaerotignum sp. MB30-C6]|uniref:sigma-70 family RNA polymerase sigma factor n=1 Tax=Anaerotignum sp. MB30-C6 TaxID=3070814 RepID=UPI0027DCC628|nr:sigma-70 family RNA polymerase sigma factor [Anaerotignum sp. MB30-C6]WMI81030.1 sigma-70 family RNA polymerase sigma factor [Anaerotignum sp. MB30-C6]
MNKKQLFEQFITNKDNLDQAFRFAFTYTKNQQDAEDVVSESVIKALRSIHKLKNTQYLKTWFYKIIINTALTQLEKNKKVVVTDYETLDDLQSISDDYSNISFTQMIQHLDENYRVIIVLRFFERLQIKEISQLLDLNENTVKTRLYRALELLKIDMEEVDV